MALSETFKEAFEDQDQQPYRIELPDMPPDVMRIILP
jgi:hypothetical protein